MDTKTYTPFKTKKSASIVSNSNSLISDISTSTKIIGQVNKKISNNQRLDSNDTYRNTLYRSHGKLSTLHNQQVNSNKLTRSSTQSRLLKKKSFSNSCTNVNSLSRNWCSMTSLASSERSNTTFLLRSANNLPNQHLNKIDLINAIPLTTSTRFYLNYSPVVRSVLTSEKELIDCPVHFSHRCNPFTCYHHQMYNNLLENEKSNTNKSINDLNTTLDIISVTSDQLNQSESSTFLADNTFNNNNSAIDDHPGSNNSSLKSPNISLDSGLAKTNSSLHLNGNTLTKANLSHSQQNNIKQKGLFIELTKLEDVQAIRAIEFHPKGFFYAIGSNSKTLRICNYSNTQRRDNKAKNINNSNINYEQIPQPEIALTRLKHHKGSIFCLGWNLSGELLATGSNDQTIKLIRFNEDTCELLDDTEQVLQMHDATVRDLCFMQDMSNNSNLLISGGAGNCKIYITDCQTATPFQAFSGHSGHILSLYTWGGAVFVSGSQDRTIRFWDLRSRGCVNLITAPSVTGQGAGGSVSSVTVDPSGRLLVSGHDDASCMLYDIRGQRVIQTFKPHNGDIRSIRFSPKAYYLLSGGYDNNVVLTDLQGDLTQPLSSLVVANHQDKVIQTKWHPNDFSFLTSSADKSAILWTLPC